VYNDQRIVHVKGWRVFNPVLGTVVTSTDGSRSLAVDTAQGAGSQLCGGLDRRTEQVQGDVDAT